MLESIYLLINILVAIVVIVLALRKPKIQSRNTILFLSVAVLFCYLGNLQYFLSPSGINETINTSIVLFGSALAATLILIFSIEYTRRPYRLGRYAFILFIFVSLLTQLLYWIPEINQFLLMRIRLYNISSLHLFILKTNSLYFYTLLTSAVLLLINFPRLSRNKLSKSDIFYPRFWILLVGPLVAMLAQGFIVLEMDLNWLDDLFLFSLNISSLGFLHNSLRQYSNNDLLPRRGNIVENMEDGWIVADKQNSIIDHNQAITKILDLPGENLHGRSLKSLLKEFPNLIDILDENKEVEIDKTLRVNDEYRYLNIRVLNLQNSLAESTGHLLLWRDVTKQRRIEEANHRARDEMFVLLNAIANAASQATSLSEFLSETIYQIIYPFRSQFVFIYLYDERSNHTKGDGYYLAAHLGFSLDSAKELKKFDASLPIFKWLEEHGQYLLLENHQDHRIPKPMRALDVSCLLVSPLLVQSDNEQKMIGSLILGRKDNKNIYNQDEIIRLTILSDQIATLIDSDRRRKLAIALSERQRLMRDIHDSVSQKLYGLVTLTEAAQAAIEAGRQMDYEKTLSRIGENARQAVKELRLFLYQLQPVDLEKEGLISVLHHRLAAVEGRADIKVRFLADEYIYLSKRKEIAMFYIAQEALNNVLRHAKAKSVSVTLKQGRKYVTLEVIDDGCGFDSESLDRGGLGLKNITERVKQENGKLKISSKVDKGTIISVSFESDFPNRSGR